MLLYHLMIIFILWSSYTSGQVPKCEEPPDIDFGDRVNDGKTEYHEGDKVWYQCSPGTTLVGSEWIQCHDNNWTRLPKCSVSCIITRQQLEEKNLLLHNGKHRSLIIPNDQSLEFSCANGYVITKPSLRTCVDGHMDFPTCISDNSCGLAPQIENAEIISNIKAQYQPGERVSYKCIRPLKMYGKPDIFCTNKTWTELPQCKEEIGKCGPPPSINNGDIISFPLHEYAPGSKVAYKCQKFYELKGSKFVTCRNGLWTKEPTCLEACILSKEMMTQNNIKFRWSNSEKIYSRTGQETEFSCIEGFYKAPGSPPFRATCIEGIINYPRCIS